MEIKNQNKNSMINGSKSVEQVQIRSNSPVETTRNTSKPVRTSNKKLKPSRKPHVINLKKSNRAPFPTTMVFSVVILTLLLLYMIMNFAEIDRYNADIAELRAEITDLQTEANKLEQRLNSKNNMVEIDAFAKEHNMVKTTDVERINITTDRTNEGATIKYQDENSDGLGVLLSGFGEMLKKLFTK